VGAVQTRPQGSSPPRPVVVGGTTIGGRAIPGRRWHAIVRALVAG
jgi:hypothetical protein